MSKRCLGCMEFFGDEFQVCPHCGYVVGTPAEEAIHMEPGTLLYDRYIVGKVLGYGGFGVTYIGWDGKLEQKVAIKEYLPSEFSTRMPGQSMVTVFNGEKSEQFHDGLTKFVEEAKRLAKFQNEDGIVKIFDSFEENETAYIIMEYLDGETLTEYLKREKTIPENKAVEMIMPVMESLRVVHTEGLLHRDIAPDNIFLTKSGEVKLIDFGASRYATTSHSRSLTVIIKPGFSPEEQYRSRGDQGPYTDVYALAATLYKMITGKTPPDAMERRAKYENANKDILEEPHKLNKEISLNRENAILNAMNVRIEDRTPDIISFIQELEADPPVKRRYGKIKKIDLYNWPTWLKVTVPSVLTVLLVFGILLATGVVNFSKFSQELKLPDGFAMVPDLYEKKVDDAIESLVNSGFDYDSIPVISSGEIDTVVGQSPLSGDIKQTGDKIKFNFIADNGKLQIDENGNLLLPNLITFNNRDELIAKLTELGLELGQETEAYNNDVAAGYVASTNPAAGTPYTEGMKIDIVWSLGRKQEFVTIPDVLGMTEEEAKKALDDVGLKVGVSIKFDPNLEAGKVFEQLPIAGESVVKGTKISITIATNDESYKPVTVPNVEGKTYAEAVKILKDAGFEVDSVGSSEADAIVEGTSPGADETVPFGATVTIVANKNESTTKPTVNTTAPTTTQKQEPTTEAEITVKVTLDANGGSVSKSSINVVYGKKYGSDLPLASKDGYSFKGWYTAKSGGTSVSADTKVDNKSAHTLYAQWEAADCSVKFDPNGGSLSDSDKTKSLKFGSTYGSLPEPTKTGHDFKGWYTAKSGGDPVTSSTTVTNSKEHTLYAQWSKNSYTLTFDANGGSASQSNKTIEYDSAYGSLPTPERTGYAFIGWYTSASGGNSVTEDTKMSASDITIYARWSKNNYRVTFDANGGSVSESHRNVAYGEKYGTLPVPTRDYYNFDGWYTAKSGGSNVSADTEMGTSNTTVYAHWTQKPVSGWVLESEMPSGAQVVENKWTYDQRTDTESESSSMSGYISNGNYWKETGRGSTKYAYFPSGFDTNHTIYKNFAKSPYTEYDNGSTKREVTNNRSAGYIYWHWMYDCGGSNAGDRLIHNKKGYGTKNNFNYKYFGAFEDTKSYTRITGVDNGSGDAGYWKTGRTSYAESQGSYYWFRFNYGISSYTDYKKIYKYYKVEQKESSTSVSAGGNISNVKHMVKYRPK